MNIVNLKTDPNRSVDNYFFLDNITMAIFIPGNGVGRSDALELFRGGERFQVLHGENARAVKAQIDFFQPRVANP